MLTYVVLFIYLFDHGLFLVEDLHVGNEADLVHDALGVDILPLLELVQEELEALEFPFPDYVLSVRLRFFYELLCAHCPPFSFCSS